MNEYLRNLNRIEFVVTNSCTGKCKHCSQGDKRNSDNIDKIVAAESVRKIAEIYNIKSVMTFGGEPLLFPETVCEIHKAAREMNIPKRQLITNGYFSINKSRIKYVAEKIISSGVNEILLSVDAFHQETIPLEYVIEFAKAVQLSEIKLKVHPAWLVSRESDNPYNKKTEEILIVFNDLGIETGEGNVVFPSGNALKYLKEYFDVNINIKSPYEEDPNDIRAICFCADGNILSDNTYKNDIIKIIDNYKPK